MQESPHHPEPPTWRRQVSERIHRSAVITVDRRRCAEIIRRRYGALPGRRTSVRQRPNPSPTDAPQRAGGDIRCAPRPGLVAPRTGADDRPRPRPGAKGTRTRGGDDDVDATPGPPSGRGARVRRHRGRRTHRAGHPRLASRPRPVRRGDRSRVRARQERLRGQRRRDRRPVQDPEQRLRLQRRHARDRPCSWARAPCSPTTSGRGRPPIHWTITPTNVEDGASIGANATIVCGTVIGRSSMVAAGSVVTRDVAPHQLVAGNPARPLGWVCRCGEVISREVAPPADLRCSDHRAESPATATAKR